MVTLTQLLLWAMWLSDYIEECYWSIYLGFSVVHCLIKLHLYLRSQPSHTRCATGQFSTPTPCRWVNLGMSVTPLSTCPNKKNTEARDVKQEEWEQASDGEWNYIIYSLWDSPVFVDHSWILVENFYWI